MGRFEALNDNEEIMFECWDKFEEYPNDKIRMKLHKGEKRELLKESILANGIITPLIVKPSKTRGRLTIISGHNRWDIAKEQGILVPYQLKTNLTQEQSDLICIDTNLLNRQHNELLTSELAWLLRTKWEITRAQGKRTDLEEDTSCTLCERSVEDEYKMSKRNIQYYIRLTYLTEDLLNLVDDKKIPFRAGVDLSYLKESEMNQLHDLIKMCNIKVSIKTAEELKRLSQESESDIDIKPIIETTAEPKEKKSFKINRSTYKKIDELIPLEDKSRIEDIILEALKLYYTKA